MIIFPELHSSTQRRAPRLSKGLRQSVLRGICLVCACTPSLAQSTVDEVVRITDSVGYEIDPQERARYSILPGYEGFILARFSIRGDRYYLRITHQREGRRLAEDILLSRGQFEAYRNQIVVIDQATRDRRQKEAATEVQKEGRFRMATDAFLYGSWLYGPGATILFEMEGNRAAGVQLLTVGGSFVAALSATRDYRLGYGRSNLIRWGNYAGTLYGLGIPVFFHSGSQKAYVGSAMLCTPLGGLLAYRLSSHRHFDKGETDLISTGGLVGGLYGLIIPFLIDIDDLEEPTQNRIHVASAMLGVPAGILATTRLIRHKPINRGRAHLITLGGIVGGYYGASIVRLAGVDGDRHPRPYVWSVALGLPVGTYFAYRLTDREEYTLGRSRLISVGAYAGALFGTGVVLAAGVEEIESHIMASVLGSATGIWFTHEVTRGWGEQVGSRFELRMPAQNRVIVSLPSPAQLLSFGILTRHHPSSSECAPLELLRISF